MQCVASIIGIFLKIDVVDGKEDMFSFNYVWWQKQSIVVLHLLQNARF